MIFLYLFLYLSYCQKILNKLGSPFQLSFNISDSKLDWIYSNCQNLRTSLHFADSSSTLLTLLDQNTSLALDFTELLFDRQVECGKPQSFSFIYKGNLVFVIKSVTLLETFYKVIRFSTTFQYFCEFSQEDLLEIQENNYLVRFLGKFQDYQLFRHGDLENFSESAGDLGYFLCDSQMKIDYWIENCRSPAEIVAKVVRAAGKSCIIQGPRVQKHVLEYGKCVLDQNRLFGFMDLEDTGEYVRVLGLIEKDMKSFSLFIYNTTHEVKCHSSKKICYFSLEIPRNPVLGSKVQVFNEDKSSSCIVGMIEKPKLQATTSDFYGHYYILSLFSITMITISLLELFFRKSNQIPQNN